MTEWYDSSGPVIISPSEPCPFILDEVFVTSLSLHLDFATGNPDSTGGLTAKHNKNIITWFVEIHFFQVQSFYGPNAHPGANQQKHNRFHLFSIHYSSWKDTSITPFCTGSFTPVPWKNCADIKENALLSGLLAARV